MNIDDILEKFPFRILDIYLDRQMKKTSGKELYSQMLDFFGDKYRARNWFYSNIPALGGKRPYDYCKERNRGEISEEIHRMEHGIFS